MEIGATMRFPGDAASDEIALQSIACGCGFHGIAVYEESRRGALDDDSFHHTGYRLDPGVSEEIATRVAACRGDERCACEAHRKFGRTDEFGRWAGLDGLAILSSFPMRLAR